MNLRSILPLFVLLLLVGCKAKNNNNELPAPQAETSLWRHPMEGFELIVIQDKAQSMSVDLFSNTSDSLLAKAFHNGETEASVNVVLLSNDKHNILIDAGLGETAGGQLPSHLKSLHLSPDAIDAVCLTHMHGDHIGGLLTAEGAAFPNAKLVMNVKEFDAWTQGVYAEKNQAVLDVLSYYADRVVLLQDGDTIQQKLGWDPAPYEPFIVMHEAAGHTVGHSVYEVGDAWILGDLLHAVSLQVQHPNCSCLYDSDAQQAAICRLKYLEEAQKQKIIAIGMHVPMPGVLNLDGVSFSSDQ